MGEFVGVFGGDGLVGWWYGNGFLVLGLFLCVECVILFGKYFYEGREVNVGKFFVEFWLGIFFLIWFKLVKV